MLGKVSFNFPEIEMEWSDKGASGEITVSFKRIEKQLQRAQYELDSQIMADMEKFMPKETGTFINVTKGMSEAIAGSGYVVAAAPPMGRFLYYGKVMVDPETNSPWARKGAKKVVTSRMINYSKSAHPQAQEKWFEAAKKQYGKQWIKKVKEIGGGG